MAHNDRFLFSPLRVGLSQEVALLRRNMKEQFHSFQVASEKFSFMCIPISYPQREAFFFFFWWQWRRGWMGSFMPCHYIYKAVQQPKSQCVMGTANNSGEEKVSHMLEIFGGFCDFFVRPCCFLMSTLKWAVVVWRESSLHKIRQGHAYNRLMVAPSPLRPLSLPSPLLCCWRTCVTRRCPNSLMQGLWEPLSVDRYQTGLTTPHHFS